MLAYEVQVDAATVARAAEQVILAAAECAALEGQSAEFCSFACFKDVLSCMHFTMSNGQAVDFEIRICDTSGPSWMSKRDPFLFQEILRDNHIRLIKV